MNSITTTKQNKNIQFPSFISSFSTNEINNELNMRDIQAIDFIMYVLLCV